MFWLHPITSQRLLKGKFYSLYEDLKVHPQEHFRYFRMSSATFDKAGFAWPKSGISVYQNEKFRSTRRKVSNDAVAQLVEALRYKPKNRGFDSRLCHWIFSLT